MGFLFLKQIKMEIVLFILLAYGITNIIVFGSIFKSLRDFLMKISPKILGKLFSCPMCLSTWIGGILSFICIYYDYATPFTQYGVLFPPLRIFFDACFTSGCVWIIHTVQEAFERAFEK